MLTLADETIHNPADFDSLAAALFITTPGLGFKMIDEHVNQQAGRGADGCHSLSLPISNSPTGYRSLVMKN